MPAIIVGTVPGVLALTHTCAKHSVRLRPPTPVANIKHQQLFLKAQHGPDRTQRRGDRCKVQAAAAEATGDVDIEEDTMTRMEKSMESTKQSFATVRTGRASPAMLDRIQVDYYGAPTPLKQIANLSAPEAGMLVIQPYDKTAIPNIEKAIMTSDLGLTPGNDGNLIRLKVPQLTADRRKEMAKLVSKLGEDGKVAIRNVRRDAMKAVDKMKDASEDEQKSLMDTVQELTDDYVKQIDALVKSKQDELTTV